MKVRFFTQPEGEKYAGALMVEKTMQDHTSAGVKPTVWVGKAAEKDKMEFPAEFREFAGPPAEAPAEVVAVAAAAPAGKAKAGRKAKAG